MNWSCPHCGFRFTSFVANGEEIPALAPLVCESCAEISLLENRVIRRLHPGELEALKQAPVWEGFIVPALAAVNAERGKRS